jgi:signal transduction histidine kinase
VALGADGRTREAYRDALVVVRDAAGRLTRTVNDIFLLARVDAKQVPTTPVPLYFDELVAETCRAMRTLAAQRTITIRCDATSGEIPYVGDEPLLERLVMNLVDNAIKYSDDEGTVSVCLTRAGGDITLRIANGGRGIPPAAQPHVFDRFYRVDEARTHSTVLHGSGSGLGLSIARWIAEFHGGRLELTEASTDVTVFTLTLPLEPALVVAH